MICEDLAFLEMVMFQFATLNKQRVCKINMPLIHSSYNYHESNSARDFQGFCHRTGTALSSARWVIDAGSCGVWNQVLQISTVCGSKRSTLIIGAPFVFFVL